MMNYITMTQICNTCRDYNKCKTCKKLINQTQITEENNDKQTKQTPNR